MRWKVVIMVFVLAIASITIATAQVSYDQQAILEELEAHEAQVALESYLDAIYGEGFMANHRQAEEDLQALYEMFPRNRSEDVIYPIYYGGAYFDEMGHLVLLIARPYIEIARTHGVLTQAFRYRVVDFSITDANETVNSIVSAVEERRALDCIYTKNISFFGIGADNLIGIYLEEYNEEMIAGFRAYVYDSPMIYFGQAERLIIHSYAQGDAPPFCLYSTNDNLYNNCFIYGEEGVQPLFDWDLGPGQALSRSFTTTVHGTSGFRVECTRSGERGILSSGHVFSQSQNVFATSALASFGTTRRRALSDFNDASFIVLHTSMTNITLTNRLPNGATAAPLTTPPTRDMVVMMAGGATGGVSHGRVTLINTAVPTTGGRTYQNMVLSTIPSRGGDSGGGVISGTAHTVGISFAGDSSQTAFVPISRVLTDLGVRRY